MPLTSTNLLNLQELATPIEKFNFFKQRYMNNGIPWSNIPWDESYTISRI